MKLSDLIKLLTELKEKHGDVPVRYQTLTHRWKPEPEYVERDQYVLLNP